MERSPKTGRSSCAKCTAGGPCPTPKLPEETVSLIFFEVYIYTCQLPHADSTAGERSHSKTCPRMSLSRSVSRSPLHWLLVQAQQPKMWLKGLCTVSRFVEVANMSAVLHSLGLGKARPVLSRGFVVQCSGVEVQAHKEALSFRKPCVCWLYRE